MMMMMMMMITSLLMSRDFTQEEGKNRSSTTNKMSLPGKNINEYVFAFHFLPLYNSLLLFQYLPPKRKLSLQLSLSPGMSLAYSPSLQAVLSKHSWLWSKGKKKFLMMENQKLHQVFTQEDTMASNIVKI